MRGLVADPDGRAVRVGPAVTAGAPSMWHDETHEGSSARLAGGMKRGCVLVVEHDSVAAETLCRTILADGYLVEQAGDAQRALAMLGSRPPDTVLLNCYLAGDGIKEVMELADQLGVPVVLMSNDRDMLALLAAFGYPHLHSPFRIGELLRSLGC